MPDIFLSYNREDQASAQRFAEAFEAEGLSVWWDVTLRSGEAYDQVTEEALRTAKAVVVLWSNKSVVSRWVRAEATLANRNRTLVPAMIEPCERPIMFELTQTADLSHWRGDRGDGAWRVFLGDVRRFVATGARDVPQSQPSSSAAASSALGGYPSLAILPFVARLLVDDVDADALVEDLAAALSPNPQFKTLAPSATLAFRDGARDMPGIGRSLGVAYLLEGALRQVGDAVRLTVQLVRASTGSILWTRKFERPLAGFAAAQDTLVGELTAHVGAQVERAEMELALTRPDASSSLAAIWRANVISSFATRAGREAAVAEARTAAAIDPGNGLAFSVLAAVQGHLLIYRGGHDPELEHEITENIRRGLALDPKNSFVHAAAAWAFACLRRPADAEASARRAVAMIPSDPCARLILGVTLVRKGCAEEGLQHLEEVPQLGPGGLWQTWSVLWSSVAQLQLGGYDRGLELAALAETLLPGTEAIVQNMLCLAKAGHWDNALCALNRLREIDPELSCATLESLAGDFHGGSNFATECIAIVRKLWSEVLGEARS
jgi:TolB-like protein